MHNIWRNRIWIKVMRTHLFYLCLMESNSDRKKSTKSLRPFQSHLIPFKSFSFDWQINIFTQRLYILFLLLLLFRWQEYGTQIGNKYFFSIYKSFMYRSMLRQKTSTNFQIIRRHFAVSSSASTITTEC